MQELEPFYRWRDQYVSEEDPKSPFYRKAYNEFEYTSTIYNYVIHPQWDDMGSRTLFIKILFADYKRHFVIIELMGEWNDAIENDIMTLRRDITDHMYAQGITKYILIAENVLNFHSSDREYYEEWFEDVAEKDGWIICLNMPEQTQQDFRKMKLNYYIELKELTDWRKYSPELLYKLLNDEQMRRLK